MCWPTLPIPSSPPSLDFSGNHFYTCVMRSATLQFTYAWNHMVFVFLCLVYFTRQHVLQIHPCGQKWQDLIFFHGWKVFHIFFVHSLVEGDLIWFCILAVVNRDAINMGVQMCFQHINFISFGYMPSCEIYFSSIFNILRHFHADFHSCCTNLCLHQ
jgi:hypothetical protein